MPLPRLQIHPNGHHLVTETGAPFFWLGDTAWSLFHRLTLAQAAFYLERRAAQGFTLIQANAIAEHGGLTVPNRNGDLVLHEMDPARPNEAYFRHVDAVIDLAARNGLYVGLLPTWGDKVIQIWGEGPMIFTPERAYSYGAWLAQCYRERTNLVWILGGDRPVAHGDTDTRPIWRAMAAGIRSAGPALITYHPPGGTSSGEALHAEPWLDVNMMQSGHGSGRDTPVWNKIRADYTRTPAKPTLDGEPNYEDHPVNPWPTWDPKNGYFRDYDVRKQCYRSVFAGGCGVTYGHHSIWPFYEPGRELINYQDRFWTDAIDRPGAWQIGHLRRLIESRPMLSRIPTDDLLVGRTTRPAAHATATKDSAGHYAMVYIPKNRPITVRMSVLSANPVRAWWFDPRTGVTEQIGEFAPTGIRRFTPPAGGPDWVLVLDDVRVGFAAPGANG